MKKPDEPGKKGKTSAARYYGLLPELGLEEVLEELLLHADGIGAHAQAEGNGKAVVHGKPPPGSRASARRRRAISPPKECRGTPRGKTMSQL